MTTTTVKTNKSVDFDLLLYLLNNPTVTEWEARIELGLDPADDDQSDD